MIVIGLSYLSLEAFAHILSYVVDIDGATSIAGVSDAFHRVICKPSAWMHSCIMASSHRIVALRAAILGRLWRYAKVVVINVENISLLDYTCVPVHVNWRWRQLFERPKRLYAGMSGRLHVFSSENPMLTSMSFKFIVSGFTPGFRIGIATSNVPKKILRAMYIRPYSYDENETYFVHGKVYAPDEDEYLSAPGFYLNNTRIQKQSYMHLPWSVTMDDPELHEFFITVKFTRQGLLIASSDGIIGRFTVEKIRLFLNEEHDLGMIFDRSRPTYLVVVVSHETSFNYVDLQPLPLHVLPQS